MRIRPFKNNPRHRHFLPHDGWGATVGDGARAQLTWKGRVKDVTGNRGVEGYND